MTEFNTLPHFYYTPNLPSAYGGKKALKRGVAKQHPYINPTEVDEWLSGQDAYTLHKPISRKFQRRKTITTGEEHQLQADLVDFSSYSSNNDGYKFLLTVIDIFSKRAFVIPLKNKSGSVVAEALARVLEQCNPLYLQTDKGKEFLNKDVKEVLKKYNVRHFSSQNEDIKASIVERFNRTLRNTIHRFFTKFGVARYIEVLDKFVESYNNRFHEAIGMTPNEVNPSNQEDVYYRLYDQTQGFKTNPPKLKIGDHVRITKARTAFQRGYTPNWSHEIFRVISINLTSPITYSIKDYNEEEVQGTFYEQELQKVKEPTLYKIEEVLQTKKVGQKKMAYVKWMGYPEEFNQWIPHSDIVDVN